MLKVHALTLVGVPLALFLGAAGCGGASGSGTSPVVSNSSGLQKTKMLTALDETERGHFCDWMANKLGGYGHSTDCGAGVSIKSTQDQASCVSQFQPPSCRATVGDWESCINAISCSDPSPSECKSSYLCFMLPGSGSPSPF